MRHRSDPATLVALSWRTKWGGGNAEKRGARSGVTPHSETTTDVVVVANV
ncbi:hypothetical protein [uncultured Porphyromonas sp.]|nr:hypothetical protein [uncultured Porphyromonas sp.]